MRQTRKILLWLGVALLFFYLGRESQQTAPTEASTTAPENSAQGHPPRNTSTNSPSAITRAFQQQQSDIPVQGTGQIIKELAEDNNGSRHQRILIRMPDGLSIMIAHNIDLAPRIEGIQAEQRIEFKGEYAWNPKGGVVHWTHHDPSGRHPDGWLKYQSRTYR